MGIVFAVRGDQLNARYAPEGALASATGSTPAVVNTAQAGINGSTSIDMSGASAAVRPLCYYGKDNVPKTGDISVLMRVYFDQIDINQGLFKLGFGGRAIIAGWSFYLTSANQLRVYWYDPDGTTDAHFGAASYATAGTWHDIFWTRSRTAGANQSKIYLDGVLDDQQLTIKSTPASTITNNLSCFLYNIGYWADSADDSRFHLDEVVVWDEVITDPTSVALTSGTGSLNGNSRTAYVDVAAQDGPAASGGGGGVTKIGEGGFL